MRHRRRCRRRASSASTKAPGRERAERGQRQDAGQLRAGAEPDGQPRQRTEHQQSWLALRRRSPCRPNAQPEPEHQEEEERRLGVGARQQRQHERRRREADRRHQSRQHARPARPPPRTAARPCQRPAAPSAGGRPEHVGGGARDPALLGQLALVAVGRRIEVLRAIRPADLVAPVVQVELHELVRRRARSRPR